MPVSAALPGFARLVAMLLACVDTFAPGRLTEGRRNELRLYLNTLCQRARLIMERLRDGTLRRHTGRRRPPKQEPGSRNVAWLESPFPKQRYWLPRLIEEIVPVSGLFHTWAIGHDLPTLFAQAPQLRRALSPIFTMLGQRLPKAAPAIPAPLIPAPLIPAPQILAAPGPRASPPGTAEAARPPEPAAEPPAPAPFVHPNARWAALLPAKASEPSDAAIVPVSNPITRGDGPG